MCLETRWNLHFEKQSTSSRAASKRKT